MMTAKIKHYFVNFAFAIRIIWTASKKYFILKTLLALISSFIPFLPLELWKDLIDALTSFSQEKSELILNKIIALAISYCAVELIEKIIQEVSKYVVFRYEDAIMIYLDNLMVDKVSSVDLAFFDNSNLKDHLDNSWRLIWSTKQQIKYVFNIIQGVVKLTISFAMLSTLNLWLIPVIVLLCFPLILFNRKAENEDYELENENAITRRKLEYYREVFLGDSHHEIRLYQLKDYFISLYKKNWQTLNCITLNKKKKTSLISLSSSIIGLVLEVIVYAISVIKLVAGTITVGGITYYVTLISKFKSELISVAYDINSFSRSSSELNDVRGFMDLKPLLDKSGTKIPGEHPIIEFKDVSFRYPNSDCDVLSHCSFVINYGETVGLVGLNGSGKSTIVKLLCRLYDPDEGSILIDGVDSKEYDITKLRELFGVLFQDNIRYSFSLRENVALSDISRIEDTDAIYSACKKSRFDIYMNDWEKGIDENLTRKFDPKGKKLSGGQWQRIALARAFFRDAPIVLLDEPSSALDPVAEHEIFADFASVSDGKSAVLISHRLSSITLCNKILVLEDGHIIEEGSHRALLEQNGRYAQLFNLQASKYL